MSMTTSPSLIAPAMGELACTSQGLRPLSALTRKAYPPGNSGTAKCLALGLSGRMYQVPLVSLLIILLIRSSSAHAIEGRPHEDRAPASRPSQIFLFMCFPPAVFDALVGALYESTGLLF